MQGRHVGLLRVHIPLRSGGFKDTMREVTSSNKRSGFPPSCKHWFARFTPVTLRPSPHIHTHAPHSFIAHKVSQDKREEKRDEPMSLTTSGAGRGLCAGSRSTLRNEPLEALGLMRMCGWKRCAKLGSTEDALQTATPLLGQWHIRLGEAASGHDESGGYLCGGIRCSQEPPPEQIMSRT